MTPKISVWLTTKSAARGQWRRLMNLTQTEVYPDRNVLSAVRNIDLEPGKRPH